MGLVTAQELLPLNLHDRQRLGFGHQLIGMSVVEDALNVVQIHDPRMLLLMRLALVDLLKPLHFTVAEERV